jgi:hypothetical protein
MLEGEGHGRPVVRNARGILFQASPCQTVGVMNRKSLPFGDQSNFGQLVNILQGFFQEDLLLYFGVRRALFATATATATATAMLMRQGLRGLAPFKPGRISSEAE